MEGEQPGKASLASSSGSRWCSRQGSADTSPCGPGARAIVRLPTGTHGLCWDREAAGRAGYPHPIHPLKIWISSLLRGNKHCICQHVRPERSGR